jgi:tetratricopeptide (TPR) repeat protein
MDGAAAGAGTPAQAAFAHTQRGLLALGDGDLAGADAAWRAGTAVAPGDADLAALGARTAWARGDRSLALSRWAEAVARRPSPAHLAGHAEALAATGRGAEAERLLGVVRTTRQLATGAGVAPDAVDVLFDADHGDPAVAVRAGHELYRRAPSTAAADAYAWALHAAGRDREALALADRALSLGGRPAAALAHRGLIRAALGGPEAAAADLRAALRGEALLSPSLAAHVRAQLATAASR